MATPLRTLLIEDNENDAELLLLALRRGGYTPSHERVETASALTACLQKSTWDVVFSDWSMPEFSGREALAVVRDSKLDLPFIIVSGSIGEEVAVEAMRSGAHDFLSKGKLGRLVAVTEREVREAAMRGERRKMQEQLLLAERMSSVGMLAAGVAHEINNPLAALMANLALANQSLAALESDDAQRGPVVDANWEAVHELLRDAGEAAERVRLIARDLKVFSRTGDGDRIGPVELKPVLESTLRMARNEVRHRARLVTTFAEIPKVRGNEARLGQVFLNLVVNAAQAIEEGRALENEIRVIVGLDTAGRAEVQVQDTGSGMSPEVLRRVFDPYFTTKPAGVGTGLGLAICHRIVADLGGQIWVESEPGRGTCFHVALPLAAVGEVAPRPVAPAAAPAAGRRGRILIVDDEAYVSRALKRMLADHDVEAVGAAAEALEQLAAGKVYDVILCDLMMPQMTGMEFHDELAKRSPEHARRMVFMTGGTFTERGRRFLEEATHPRIEKPFDLEAVRGAIRRVLAQ